MGAKSPWVDCRKQPPKLGPSVIEPKEIHSTNDLKKQMLPWSRLQMRTQPRKHLDYSLVRQ